MPEELDVNLTDPEVYRSGFPHELFTDLRGRGAVLKHPAVELQHPAQAWRDGTPVEFWMVLRHAEVLQASRDAATFSAVAGPQIGPFPPDQQGHTLVSSDAPAHTRLRKLISAGFTPRMIARLDERVAMWADRALDDLAAHGEGDFVREVAAPLPMHLVADIVGIPQDDRAWVFGRVDTLLRCADPASGLTADYGQTQFELFEYAQNLGKEKRARPADDVWSVLATAELPDDDGGSESLSEIELDMFFLILATAGSDTTRNTISQGLVALTEHPDQLDLLRNDLSRLETTTDEMIRWASPIMQFARTATRDVELGGAAIHAGDRVTLWYPSANRDERVFDQPFRFDGARKPNPHVSFGGGGVHYCLGVHLARRQLKTMLEKLITRFADIEITGPPVWTAIGPEGGVGVSMQSLPVRVRNR